MPHILIFFSFFNGASPVAGAEDNEPMEIVGSWTPTVSVIGSSGGASI